MYIVGLSGGIGSGKTAISDRLAAKGIVVVDADQVARQVVEPGTEALAKIAEHFGPEILTTNGELDRAKLRQIIFSDAEAKQWLEGLLHPLIGTETWRQLETANSPYVLMVSPLLIESGQNAVCQRVIVVDVSVDTQIERTCSRDNNDEEQVRRIIASQADRDTRRQAATDIINNDGSLEQLQAQVDNLHLELISAAAEHAA